MHYILLSQYLSDLRDYMVLIILRWYYNCSLSIGYFLIPQELVLFQVLFKYYFK